MKNTQKLLIHKLRKDRIQLSNYNKKKQKLLLAQGGALFSKKKNSQHTSLDDATFDAETESHIKGTKESSINAGKIAGIAAVGFQVAEATVSVATPLLAMSGVGIPLAAALFVLSEFSKMAKVNAELMVFAKDSEFILSQFVKLHRMMIRVIIEYFNAFDSDVDIDNKISNNSSPDDDDDDEEKNPSKIKELQKFSIDSTIIKNIEAKLNEFGVTLKSLNLDKKYSIKRFTYSASTLSKLAKIITVLNAYFIIYNAKFEHLIRHYNYVVGQENSAKSLEIWDNIHASDEYKTYMGQMNQNPKEYLNKIKTAVVNDPNAKKQVNKADNKNKSNAQKLIQNVKNEEGENTKDTPQDKPEDTPQDKPEDTPQDKPEDTPQDKPEDKPQDKPEDKPQFKPPGIPPQEELDKMKVEDILGGGSPLNSKGQNIAQFVMDFSNNEKKLIIGLDEYFGHYNSFDPETGNTAVLALIQRTKQTGEPQFVDFLQYFFDKNQTTKAVPNKNGDLPITEAIHNNFFAYAELILRSPTHQYDSIKQTFVPLSDISNGRGNINLNQQDSKGYTALTAIVQRISGISNNLPLLDSIYDKATLIKELIFDDYLLFMSDISVSTNEGKTPFIIAAINDDISLTRDLLELENNINNKVDFENQQPQTGLFSSIQYPFKSLDINAQDKDGNTALMYAIKNYMPFDSDDDNMSVDYGEQLATFLLQDNPQTRNINVNLQNKDNDSALHIAVKLRYLDIIIQLLEKNANPFLENNQFHTPMFIAMAGLNSIEIDAENPTYETVIDYDKKEDYKAILNIMLSYGIDFKKITSFKSSIMTNCTNYDPDNNEVIDSFSQEKIHPNNIVLVPTENPIQQITHPFMPSKPQNEKGSCYDKENFWVWIVTQLSNGSRVTDPLTRKSIHPDWIKRTYTSKNFQEFITEVFKNVNMDRYMNDPTYRMPQVNLERFHHLVRFYLGND